MTAPSLLDELASEAKWLRKAAEEIAKEDHAGWGNTCTQAAECIERHHAALADMAKRLETTERTLERCKQTLDTASECWRLDAERLEAAERDAARYRWLRNQATAGVMTTPCHGSLNCDEPESEWDAWIDAAKEGEG